MPISKKEINNGKYIDDQMANVVPSGGATNQVLTKVSNSDYDTYWSDKGSTSGGYIVRPITTSQTYTDTSGKYVILVDTTAGAVTITLGSANTNNSEYIIKKTSSSATANVIIASSSSIEFGSTATIINQGASVTIISNGLTSAASWFIV